MRPVAVLCFLIAAVVAVGGLFAGFSFVPGPTALDAAARWRSAWVVWGSAGVSATLLWAIGQLVKDVGRIAEAVDPLYEDDGEHESADEDTAAPTLPPAAP